MELVEVKLGGMRSLSRFDNHEILGAKPAVGEARFVVPCVFLKRETSKALRALWEHWGKNRANLDPAFAFPEGKQSAD